MKKRLLTKMMLLLCALIVGSSSVWADTETFAYGDYKGKGTSSSGSEYTMEKTDVSIKNTKFYGNNSYAHFYASGTTTITPATGVTITGIELTASATGYNGYQSSGTVTASTGSVSGSTSSTTVTWSGSATSAFTISNNKQIRWTSIVVTYTKAATHTITTTVNDALMGSASLSGTTITATPADGYRVANGDDGYTVTSGTATVTHTGYSNTLTVSASTDCTVQVNFEAIPTHTLSSAVSPAAAGTVTFGSTTVAEGATTTATAAAEAGYKFTGWSITGTGAELSSTTDNPTTITMGTADATVTATFEAVTTYAITYSVNGNETVVNVEEDAEIDLSAPASGIPAGYTFIGWRTSTLSATDTNPNDYVTSATSTAEITYYAVMAVQTASLPDTYEKLTSNSFETSTTYLIGGKQSADVETIWYVKSYANVDSNSDWGVATTTGNEAITFTLSGTASALVAQDNSGNYLEGLSTGKFKMSSTEKTVYLNSDGSIKASASGYNLRHNYNSGNGGFRWYNSSNAMNAYFYKVVKNNVYKNFCTTLSADPVSVTPAKTYTTLTSAYPLDFTSVSSDLAAYIATEISAGSVQMTQVNKVPANTGLVLKATTPGSAVNVPVLSGDADDVSANKMAGSAFSTTAVAEDAGYILKDGVFQPSSGGDLPAGKAYLNIAVPAGAPALTLNFGDFTPTGIDASLKNSEEAIKEGVYNLAGQRVMNPTKGLYIVGGRKVVIK